MLTPEGHEKKVIKKYLDSIGAWHFSPSMTGFGKSGVPDIVACCCGSFIGIEVKREGKLPTKLQERRMAEISKAGGLTLWGTSEKVIKKLEVWRKYHIRAF